jgi:hypothetical protein
MVAEKGGNGSGGVVGRNVVRRLDSALNAQGGTLPTVVPMGRPARARGKRNLIANAEADAAQAGG